MPRYGVCLSTETNHDTRRPLPLSHSHAPMQRTTETDAERRTLSLSLFLPRPRSFSFTFSLCRHAASMVLRTRKESTLRMCSSTMVHRNTGQVRRRSGPDLRASPTIRRPRISRARGAPTRIPRSTRKRVRYLRTGDDNDNGTKPLLQLRRHCSSFFHVCVCIYARSSSIRAWRTRGRGKANEQGEEAHTTYIWIRTQEKKEEKQRKKLTFTHVHILRV